MANTRKTKVQQNAVRFDTTDEEVRRSVRIVVENPMRVPAEAAPIETEVLSMCGVTPCPDGMPLGNTQSCAVILFSVAFVAREICLAELDPQAIRRRVHWYTWCVPRNLNPHGGSRFVCV